MTLAYAVICVGGGLVIAFFVTEAIDLMNGHPNDLPKQRRRRLFRRRK